MTHPGDNPFLNNSSGWVTDDGLADLIDGSDFQENQHDQLDEDGKKIMKKVLAIFDECEIGRIVDTDQEVENRLQEERLDLIRSQVEADMLQTLAGAELFASGQLRAAIELRSQLALIATRRMHNYILEMATILNAKYADLTSEQKQVQLQEFEDEKRIYILLLRDHYQLDMNGWPVAFDRATPGEAFRDGVDWDCYAHDAEQEAALMRAKDLREAHELDEMISLLGVHDMHDDDKAVTITIALAFIQEIADNIERLNEPNAVAQIGEMIWEIGSRFGLGADMCRAVARYYDGDSLSSLN